MSERITGTPREISDERLSQIAISGLREFVGLDEGDRLPSPEDFPECFLLMKTVADSVGKLATKIDETIARRTPREWSFSLLRYKTGKLGVTKLFKGDPLAAENYYREIRQVPLIGHLIGKTSKQILLFYNHPYPFPRGFNYGEISVVFDPRNFLLGMGVVYYDEERLANKHLQILVHSLESINSRYSDRDISNMGFMGSLNDRNEEGVRENLDIIKRMGLVLYEGEVSTSGKTKLVKV